MRMREVSAALGMMRTDSIVAEEPVNNLEDSRLVGGNALGMVNSDDEEE